MNFGHDESIHSKEAIGARLKALREAEGLNQSEMSRRLGTERANWNNWELGRVTVPINQVFKLTRIFGVTSDWIYFGDHAALSRKLREKLFSRRR